MKEDEYVNLDDIKTLNIPNYKLTLDKDKVSEIKIFKPDGWLFYWDM